MKKILLALLFVNTLQAETQGYFPITGQQAVINIRTQSVIGGRDQTPEDLYNLMLVPPVSSIGGTGKTITDATKSMSIVCADRGKNNFFCNIVIKKSINSEINPLQKKAIYEITGEEATRIAPLFKSENGLFKFKNEAGSLFILSSSDLFQIIYEE